MRPISFVVCAVLLAIGVDASAADRVSETQPSSTVVFSEPGFPSADSAGPSQQLLAALLPAARFAPATELATLLKDPATRLLVLPYGSAFPEESWPDILGFLKHGGNLLVLGGRPFTRSAYHDASGWKLRAYSVRFTRALMIDQYQTTPGSDGLQFQLNPDLPVKLTGFAWGRAFSPIIRLSSVDLYHRGGSAGSIDARLDPLAWGVKDGRKLAAPAIEIDHLRNGFGEGRWVFLNSELATDFYKSAASAELVRSLAERALRSSEEFNVHPVFPLYFPGEPIQLEVDWHTSNPSSAPLTVKITSYPADRQRLVSRQIKRQPARKLPEPCLLSPSNLYSCQLQKLKASTSSKHSFLKATRFAPFITRDFGFETVTFCAPARA